MMTQMVKRKVRKFETWELRAAALDPAYRQQLNDSYHALHADVLTPGSVVEFLRQGHACSGILVRSGSWRHRVMDLDGKEHYIGRERVVDISSVFVCLPGSRHEVLQTLRRIDQDRAELAAAIDSATLWELASGEALGWTLEELAALYYPGDPGPHGIAALFRALLDGGYFWREELTFFPLSPERVAVHQRKLHRQADSTAWLREAAAWLRALAHGEAGTPPAHAERALRLLADRVLFGYDHPEAPEAATLARLAHFHTREALLHVLELAGYWEPDENLDLLRYDTPMRFSDTALAEAEMAQWDTVAATAPEVTGRRVYTFTEAGRRPERAVSFRADRYGFTVGLHLASPALLMPPGGAVQREAEERAVALELPDRALPLLPPALTQRLTLDTGEARPCLTLTLRFAPDFTLKAAHWAVQRVRVTHPSAAEGRMYARDAGLRKLYALARHLLGQRVAAGGVVITEPEVVVQAENGTASVRQLDMTAPGRVIDRELTILANEVAGAWCRDRVFRQIESAGVVHTCNRCVNRQNDAGELLEVPAIYRTEAAPLERLVSPDDCDPVQNFRQKRLMSKAILQTEPAPHGGIGAAVYAPVTAPLRRYTDLVMHQQVLGCLSTGQAVFTAKELQAVIDRTAAARLTGREIVDHARRYWLLRALERQAGETVSAVVLERYAGGCLVELTGTLLTVYCETTASFRCEPGTTVTVRLHRVDARGDVLRVQMIG